MLGLFGQQAAYAVSAHAVMAPVTVSQMSSDCMEKGAAPAGAEALQGADARLHCRDGLHRPNRSQGAGDARNRGAARFGASFLGINVGPDGDRPSTRATPSHPSRLIAVGHSGGSKSMARVHEAYAHASAAGHG
jgi:hypothetical protein